MLDNHGEWYCADGRREEEEYGGEEGWYRIEAWADIEGVFALVYNYYLGKNKTVYAKDKEIICSIHASIKGSLLEIVKKAVKTLINKEKVDPKNIYAIYGPGVSFSHVEANEDIFKKVEKLGYTKCLKRSMNTDYIDINLLNYMQLVDAGVPASHILLNKYDTYDNANLFFSSMRNNITGRMLSVIQFTK